MNIFNIKKNLLLICIIIPFSSPAITLQKRVEDSLISLENKLGDGNSDQKASNLLKLEARKDVFALQSYGRLFQNQFKYFKNMKQDFKTLEDAIGQAQKWEDLLLNPNLSKNLKSKYQKKLNQETKNLSHLLKKWDQVQTLKYYRNKVVLIDLNQGQSNDLALESIKNEIKNAKNKKFDFTYGETGLHELRRTIRWIVLDFEIFKDLFSTNKTTCDESVNDLYNLGLQSKSNVLAYNPDSSLEVDYCSYLKILGSVKLLGYLKDKLEEEGIINDKLPKEVKLKTESIYFEIIPFALKNLL